MTHLDQIRKYLEDNIKFEEISLRRAVEVDDKLHRSSNLSTFLRILRLIDSLDNKTNESEI